MRLILDTNVLVRAVVQDDPDQAGTAARLLREADLVAVPTSCLCELVWVLLGSYKLDRTSVAGALRRLIYSASIRTSSAAAEAGLALHDAGGDFADGVIAFEGDQLGAETFVSFDRDAVRLIKERGMTAFVPVP